MIALSVALLLTAGCGNDDQNNGSGGLLGGSGTNNTLEPSLTPSTSEITGTLLYVVEDDLYRWGDTEPERLLNGIASPLSTTFSPDGKYVLYTSGATPITEDGNGPVVESLDLTSGETQTLTQFRFRAQTTRGWRVAEWSDDGQWALIDGTEFSSGIRAVKLDGSAQLQVSLGFGMRHYWLEGRNSLAVISTQFRQDSPDIEVDNIQIADLDAATVTDLSVEYPVSITEVRGVLANAGYELAESLDLSNFFEPGGPYRVLPPIMDSVPEYCGEWQIRDENNNPIVSLTESGGITDLIPLSDGTFLFMKWEYPGCDFFATPNGELVHFMEGDRRTIADGLGSADVRNLVSDGDVIFEGVRQVHRVALGPDETQVAWIGYSDNESTSTLYITDLTTLETDPLTTISQPEGGGLIAVYWLDT
jgi:hypothetical protein